MSTMLVILFTGMLKGPFVADASAETSFLIMRPESVVRTTLNDIYVLQRNMPGVVAIAPIGERTWLYTTERRMPFSEVIKTDFVLMRGDGTGVTYHTPDVTAANWMLFRFELAPAGANQTTLRVRVRVRLVRENGGDIHLFAPVLGEDFISDRMHEDLTGMLERFVANVVREFEASHSDIAADGDLR